MNKLPAPIRVVIDLFSSVRFGIALLVMLFIYSSIGSAGILYPVAGNLFDLDSWDIFWVRQMRGLEMTEFEWFHWWPFTLLIALLCLTLVVTTLRRIPLNRINFGVWMIHSGIITLALGSVWYFAAKVEGDTPILRRRVVVEFADGSRTDFAALPGSRAALQTADGPYRFEVVDIDPDWKIRSDEHAGLRAYAVSVRISSPGGVFIRHLLDGYPQYTEDVIPGKGRAINERGVRVLDERLSLSLTADVQPYFYLVHTDALYLREVGSTEWIERPVASLPRYNEYIGDLNDVWLPPSMSSGGPRPLRPSRLNIVVPPVDEHDPMPGATFVVAGYLPYALVRPRVQPGGDRLRPFLRVRLSLPDAADERLELMAFDRTFSDVDESIAAFRWIGQEDELEALRQPTPGLLHIRIPEYGVDTTLSALDLNMDSPEFIELGDSGHAVRIRDLQDRLDVPGMQPISYAIVDVRTPQRTFNRWVFDDPSRNRDQEIDAETGEIVMVETDRSIDIVFSPAVIPSVLTFVGGPDPRRLRLLALRGWDERSAVHELVEGTTITLAGDVTLHVEDFWPFTHEVSRPFVVPESQRNPNLVMRLRMIQVELPGPGGEPVSRWLHFHDYPFDSASSTMRGYIHQPQTIVLSDGRTIELLYSRRRRPLPSPVMLDDFVVDWHVGGFSGANTSVRNWTSVVRFLDEGHWSDREHVAVNAPGSHRGYWFFQSRWDAPDVEAAFGATPSRGLNFTVLGVGNRQGVHVQLFGCALAVIGMIYAFYVKPILRRRERDRLRAAAVARADAAGDNSARFGPRGAQA